MEWDDEAVVLSVRRHGEHGGIVALLTLAHGRHSGLLHGAGSSANRGLALSGNAVRVWWRGRGADALGAVRLELIQAHAGAAMGDPGRLAALSSACALAEATLPERQPHPGCHAALSALLGALPAESWPSVYVHFELALLRDLGFGLDLGACAVSGVTRDLAYVSPKSGRAVARAAAGDWRHRLLPLPGFLVAGGEGDMAQIRDGLRLTGYFLARHLGPLPAARARLVDRFTG